MPFAVRRVPAFVILSALAALVVSVGDAHPRLVHARPVDKTDAPKAESKTTPAAPAEAAGPTAAEAKAVGETFRAERAAAVAAGFPAESLARADDLAKRAAAALAVDHPRLAARYYRDARWQVPYLPANLPPHVVRVFGESRMRHAGPVYALAYSPDGGRLASASGDGTVKVWDLGNGRDLVTYRGHAEQLDDPTKGTTNVLAVAGVAFQPGGTLAASVGGAQVHLWDPATGKLVKVLAKLDKPDQPLKCLAFSPDGAALAVGGDDGILRVYAVESGKATFTAVTRNARIERVAYSPNGKFVGVADNAGNAAVYAPGAANPMPMSANVVEGGGECHGIAFTADGGAVLTCGRDGKPRLTAGPNPDGTAAGNTATRLRDFTGHSGAVFDLAVPADRKTLVTGGEDRTVRVWEVASGKPLRSFQGHMKRVLAVAVRADGRQVASGSEDGAIRLWDLSAADDHRAIADAAEPVWAVAVSADGKRAAAAGGDKLIRVYDPESGKLETTLTGHTAAVTALAFLPDNNQLVSAGGDRVVRVWDVTTGKVVREMPGHESAVLAVAVSPDGQLIVSGAADRTVRGWAAATGKPLWTWTAKTAVCGVAVRPGGKQVAVGTADGTLVVLALTAGGSPAEAAALPAHIAGVAAVAYSPDGSKLATAGGDGAVRVWTVGETGRPDPLARFEGQTKPGTVAGFSPLSAVAFAPDGRCVAAAGADAVVRVWDVQTKAEVRGLRGHTEWATAVAFGPAARFLVSGGADKTVRVFELAPQEGTGPVGHLLAANAVAVSPDGKSVATASADETVKVWDLNTGRELVTLLGNTDTPFAVTFLGPDTVVMGGSLPTRDSGRLHVWQTAPARLAHTVPTGEVYTVAGAADGLRVAAWSARVVVGGDHKASTYEVFDRAGKVLLSAADKGRDVKAASFSADLAWAAAGDVQGVVRIYDLEKKEPIAADWPVFANPVGDLGLTPDKKLLVAIDQNGLVKVADVAKRETLVSAAAHRGGVRGLIVSPKGDTFVTLGADREVKAWALADLKDLKPVRTWTLPVGVNGAAYSPDGKTVVTANADGTAYALELP